jgi:hypothetical protein
VARIPAGSQFLHRTVQSRKDRAVLSDASIAPRAAPADPKELLQDYEAGMAAIAQKQRRLDDFTRKSDLIVSR